MKGCIVEEDLGEGGEEKSPEWKHAWGSQEEGIKRGPTERLRRQLAMLTSHVHVGRQRSLGIVEMIKTQFFTSRKQAAE